MKTYWQAEPTAEIGILGRRKQTFWCVLEGCEFESCLKLICFIYSDIVENLTSYINESCMSSKGFGK